MAFTQSSRSGGGSERPVSDTSDRGVLIVNADDWGRDPRTTDMILDCTAKRTVSAVSAMVFMNDSERASSIARERDIDSGLHLNFTTPFTGTGCPLALVARQQTLAAYLRRHRLSQVVFHPGLSRSFEYVMRAQLDEFRRLYGAHPHRLDGHHHMHLCANVLFGGLLPRGTLVRRNFSFEPGERSQANRLYRRLIDSVLKRHHQTVDLFFSLPPFEPVERLQRIFSLARQFVIELETHPANPDEHRFLTGAEIWRWLGDVSIARPQLINVGAATPPHGHDN